MLKDDRMMGMLTFVVILLALGTLIQRVDLGALLFGGGAPAVELRADEAVVQATRTLSIDVLANDAGVGPQGEERLTVVASPACGRAFVRDGRIRYLGTHGCVGEQSVRYGLDGSDAVGEVRISVRAAAESAEPDSERPEAETPATETPAAETPEPEAEPRVAADSPDSPSPDSPSPDSPSPDPAEAAAAADAPDLAGSPAASPATPGDTREPGDGLAARDAGDDTMALARVEPDAEAGETEGPARDAPGAEPAPREDDAANGAAAAVPARDGPEAPAEAREQPAPAPPDEAAEEAAPAEADCTEPPAVTLDVEPAGMTRVLVNSPCHADGVADLAYDGLSFAVPLDAEGAGSLEVPGFQGASDASLELEGREPMDFIIPFRDIERLERVAVVWQAPSDLALHAFEFGARPGGEGHISPAEPRSFEAVRRDGGGWLATYTPEQGHGQRIEVYSFWRRYGGPSGVVRLGLEPGDAGGPQECAGGSAGGADFKVLRMVGGRPAEPRLGRVAPLDCTALAAGPGRLIDEAVDDLIVRRR